MKTSRIYSAVTALLLGAAVLTACSDKDDYSASTTPLLTDGSVVTGSSDVTATSATFHGTVSGLETANKASYSTGFKYGFTQDALTETASSSADAEFSSTITGLQDATTIYYQAFVTLQGRVTYKGEVKSLITTDATAVTGDASGIDYTQATLAGSISKYPADAKAAGIVISTNSGDEAVRAGLRLSTSELSDSYTYTKAGLLPSTTYYYAAFLDLGPGVVYGEVKQFSTPDHEVSVDEEFVDLGLSVKWAKRNLGAKTEGDLGGLFAFGDLTGVNPSIDPADYASYDTYKTDADVVFQIMDNKATLPTADQFEELFSLCKVEYGEVNGAAGYKFTGPNGNSIFLPAAGKRVGHDVQDVGVKGYYLTGSVNPSVDNFAIDYEFNESAGSRATRATYEALSVRPVSTARDVKLDKSLLYHTWYLDIDEEGKTRKFSCPLYFYGSDDSWRTVTNGEPIAGDVWCWAPDYAGNTWICEAKDYGFMILKEDGTIEVNQGGVSKTGTFTVDEKEKTITLEGVEILYLDNYRDQGTNWSRKLKIMAIDETGMQIGVMRDNSPEGLCTWSFNYINEEARKPTQFTASLLFWDDMYNQAWASNTDEIKVEEGKQYTFEVSGQRAGGKVVVLDFVGLAATYPNAIIRIDKIETDGNEVPFDVAKFKTGDIEGNGNYRVELFNIWGAGTGSDSPFGGGAKEQEPALAFNSTLKITYTILTLEGFQCGLSAAGSDWSGNWGDEKIGVGGPGTYTVVNHFPIPDGMVVVVDITDFATAFPNASVTLNKVEVDGKEVAFDESKIKYGDIESKGNYRIELFNIFGSGTAADSPFGGGAKDFEPALGFTDNMAVTFTVNSLY